MNAEETINVNEPVRHAVQNENPQLLRSPVKRNPNGRFVGSRQKVMIINLYKTKLEEQPDIKYKPLIAYLSKASGIGRDTTIRNYKNDNQLKSPNKTKIRTRINEKIDDFDKNAIRVKNHSFWLRNEVPTLKKIVQAISDDPNLPTIPRTSLQRILKELGFEYTKRARNSALTERGDLIVWRQKFIIDIRRFRSEGRTIYYLDETWVNAGECCSKVWLDKTVTSHRDAFVKELSTGPKNPTGKGKRLIWFHIGSSEGFVEGGLLCFESKKKTQQTTTTK